MAVGASAVDCHVLIVGGGPTGLAAANLLGRYGVNTLLVERNATTVQEPRAVSIDDESLRTVQAIGAISDVMQHVVAGYGSEYLTPDGEMFLKVEPTSAPYGYPRRNAFRQPVFEAQLREHLRSFASVDMLFGWRLASLDQNETTVTVKIVGPEDEHRTLRCAYVIAADGASSVVRGMLGLSLEGESFSEKWLIVDLENSPAQSLETIVFCDARRPCIALPGPNDTRRFEFKLVPGDDPASMTDDTTVRKLLRTHGAAAGSKVRRKTIYTFHARLASRWSRGRVFLAGDACHLTPPFAGQGMNSGIRDAHNIAWKLAWIVDGMLPANILASYEQERREHVGEMIKLALRMGRIMGPRNRLAGWLTQTAFRLLGRWPAARDYFAQMKYKPKPRFAKGLLLSDGRPRRRTSVGRLLPQPSVNTVDGPHLLDELLGDGFALLGYLVPAKEFGVVADQPAIAALRPKHVLVVPANFHGQTRPGVLSITDPASALRQGLDAPDGRIFLIRPDRYVLGTFLPPEAAVFAARLSALLGSVQDRLPVEGETPALAGSALGAP